MGRTATDAYNAERNLADMTGARDLAFPTNPVDRLPEADADAVSPLFNLCECVRWLRVCGRGEHVAGAALAKRLEALEDEVDEWMDEVGYVAGPRPTVDWDDDTDWKEGRW